ncbi:MAG: TMEM198/TM7SF3 family protein [Ignavibacteria bacterium]|nr:TMEM198/TM7SF3 family protein [Ignavibacteria bacterium]
MDSMLATMTIPLLVAGISLLVFGRKLFWLFVGAVGFVAGMVLASKLFQDQPQSVFLIAGVGTGLLGAIVALFVQHIAIGIAGFLAGGFAVVTMMDVLGVGTLQFPWVPFIVGGIVGAVLVAVLFEWALVVLSSITGAAAIVYALAMPAQVGSVAFVILSISGVVIQASLKRKGKKEG